MKGPDREERTSWNLGIDGESKEVVAGKGTGAAPKFAQDVYVHWGMVFGGVGHGA